MALFRRENDQRRVAKFPNKATAEQTISLIAKSGALRDTGKFNRAESKNTRSEISEIQKDAKTLADSDPKKFAAKDSNGQPSIWDDNKPNFNATREAQVWPSKSSLSGKPGMAGYSQPPAAESKPKDIWS